MPNVGNARQLRRLSQMLRRIRRAIRRGVLSDAELAVAAVERWGQQTAAPAYKQNAYARSWIRLREARTARSPSR
jgi:hypothetical protein